MSLQIFERQLRLMILLTQNRYYTIEQLCDKLQLSPRTVYRYLELFDEMNQFEVYKNGNIYRIDKSSKFFQEITQLIHFTEDEAIMLRHALDACPCADASFSRLQQKLAKIYDLGILDTVQSDSQHANNLRNIYHAVKNQQQIILRNYNSPHSNTTSDRLVEPYHFLNGNDSILCYEPASHSNKTFVIQRIGSVQTTEQSWQYKHLHHQLYVDLFSFSGDKLLPIELRMGRLATNILKEEYPRSTTSIKPDGPNHSVFSTEVCSFVGIGRFVIGLLDDIQIIQSPEFINYVQQKLSTFNSNFSKQYKANTH